jgi:hypothetical protein
VLTQDGGPHSAPRSRLVEAKLGIKPAPRAAVVTMRCNTVRIAIAGRDQHRATARVATWCRGGTWHGIKIKEVRRFFDSVLGFHLEQSVHTNVINHQGASK